MTNPDFTAHLLWPKDTGIPAPRNICVTFIQC